MTLRRSRVGLCLSDFTVSLRRTMMQLDRRHVPEPEPFDRADETNLLVLARFGVACAERRRLTRLGRQLVDEGATR